MCLARKLLWVQQYLHSSHLNRISPLLEGLDSNLEPSNSMSRPPSIIFAITPFDGKCQNLETSFFTFLIFTKVLSVLRIILLPILPPSHTVRSDTKTVIGALVYRGLPSRSTIEAQAISPPSLGSVPPVTTLHYRQPIVSNGRPHLCRKRAYFHYLWLYIQITAKNV